MDRSTFEPQEAETSVFLITCEDKYGGVFLPQEKLSEGFILNGTSRIEGWKPLPVSWAKPRRRHANFEYAFCGQSYVIDGSVYAGIEQIFRDSCEFLPLVMEGQQSHYLLNPVVRVDCLDEEKTKWRGLPGTNHSRYEVNEYHFIAGRVRSIPIFLLPDRCELYTATGVTTPDREFKSIIEREGFTGLKFRSVWSEGANHKSPKTVSRANP
jgi:hypothetical protein